MKLDLQLLSQCDSTYDCLRRSAREVPWHVAGTLSNQQATCSRSPEALFWSLRSVKMCSRTLNPIPFRTVKGTTSQVAGSPAVLDQTVIVLDRTVIVLDQTVIVLDQTVIVLDQTVIVLDRTVIVLDRTVIVLDPTVITIYDVLSFLSARRWVRPSLVTLLYETH